MKSFVTYCLVFAAGLCLGIGFTHFFHQQAMERMIADSPAAFERLFSRQLIETLDLSPDKKTVALRLISEVTKEIRKLKEKHRPEYKELLLNLGKQLKNLASQNQEKPIDDFIERLVR